MIMLQSLLLAVGSWFLSFVLGLLFIENSTEKPIQCFFLASCTGIGVFLFVLGIKIG